MARLLRLLLPSATCLSLVLAACGSGGSAPPGNDPPPDPPGTFRDGFETGLGSWAKAFDLPPDPNDPGDVVEWSIEASAEQAFQGQQSARFVLDGRQDDGTIWLVRAFDVTPQATHTVSLSVMFWSESESFNTTAMVAAYAGPVPPTVELDFDTTRPLNLTAGWAPYAYTFEVTSGDDGRIWVAFGISAVWETWMTYYADEVRVGID